MMRALSVSIGLGETERGAFRTEGGARELSVGEEEDCPGGVRSI
jgi:hypothetical protein